MVAAVTKKQRVYLAGPMRGLQYFGFDRFDRAEARWRAKGYDVVSPAALDRARGFDPYKLDRQALMLLCAEGWQKTPEGFDLHECVRDDIKHLLTCDKVIMLTGWASSKGATAEHAVALWAGIPVVLDETYPPVTPVARVSAAATAARIEAAFKATDNSTLQFGPASPVHDPATGEQVAVQYTPGEVRSIDPDTGAMKGVKLERFDLIPVGPLTELAQHYGVGSKKYADRNWERGYGWSKSYAACQRHLTQFWGGEDRDAETGSKHLIAAAWHCLAMAEFMETHPEKDDRPKGAH